MDIGRYKIIKLLGRGSYGKIYLSISNTTQEKVVIKMLSLKNKSKEYIKTLQDEIDYLKELLGSKYVVKYIDDFDVVIENRKYKAIVMEDLSCWITLGKYIKRLANTKTQILPEILKKLIFGLIRGIKYIHDKDIAHRDIKPENIMINEDWEIKYIDFGLSCSKNCEGTRGTPLYLPPETCVSEEHIEDKQSYEEKRKMEKKHDIWSLGLVIYQLCNLRDFPYNFPFDVPKKSNIHTFIDQMKKNPHKYPSTYFCGGFDSEQFINKMLEVNPEIRVSAQDLFDLIEFSSEV